MSKTGNFHNIPVTLRTDLSASLTDFRYYSKSGDDSNDGFTPETPKTTPSDSPTTSFYSKQHLIGQGTYYGGNMSLYSRLFQGIGDVIFDGSALSENGYLQSSGVQGNNGGYLDVKFQNYKDNNVSIGATCFQNTYNNCEFDNVMMYSEAISTFGIFDKCKISNSTLILTYHNYLPPDGSLSNTTIINSILAIENMTGYHTTYTGLFFENCYIDNQSILVLPDTYFGEDSSVIKMIFRNCAINCPIYMYNNGNYILKYNTIFEYIGYLESIGLNTTTEFTKVSMLSPYSNPDNTLSDSSPFINGGTGGITDIGAYEQAEYNSSLFPSANYFHRDSVETPNNDIEFNSTDLGYSLKVGIDTDYLVTEVKDELELKTYNKNILDADGITETSRINSHSPKYNTCSDFVIEFSNNELYDVSFNFKFDDGDLTISTSGTNDTYVYTERNVTISEGTDFTIGLDLDATIANIETAINNITGLSCTVDTNFIHIYKIPKDVYVSGDYEVYEPETIILELTETSSNTFDSTIIHNALGSNPNLDTYEARWSDEPFLSSESEITFPYRHILSNYQPTICRRGTGDNERIFGNGDIYGYFNYAIAENITYRYVQERYTLTIKNIES